MKHRAFIFASGALTGALLTYVLVARDLAGGGSTDAPPARQAQEASRLPQRVVAGEHRSGSDATAADGNSSELAGIERLAAEDPLLALERLRSLDRSQRLPLLNAIARIWAAGDPELVVDEILQISNRNQREDLLQAVLTQWWTLDSAGLLEYLGAMRNFGLIAPSAAWAFTAMDVSAGSDYAELLNLAEALPARMARDVRLRVIRAMAHADPAAAAASIDKLPGIDRASAATAIAIEYASVDPEAALRWAQAINAAEAVEFVLGEMALKDPYGALEIALAIDGSQDRARALSRVTWSAMASPVTIRDEFAAAVLSMPDVGLRRQMLQDLANIWLDADPETAMEWFLSQRDAVPDSIFELAAGYLADYPNIANRYIDRVPQSVRSRWIQSVAEQYAQIDPDQALLWADQYRDEPGYSSAVSAVVLSKARYEPAQAAELIDRAGLAGRATLVANLAGLWADSDPVNAARWAESIQDPNSRAQAYRRLAMNWAIMDANAAEQWAVGMQPGGDRDSALESIASVIVTFDLAQTERVLEAIGDDRFRQQAAVNAGMRLRPQDRNGALRLIDRYVTEPELREPFERLQVGIESPDRGL